MGIPTSYSQTPELLCHQRQVKAAAEVPPTRTVCQQTGVSAILIGEGFLVKRRP